MHRWFTLLLLSACSGAPAPTTEAGSEPGRGAAYSMKQPSPQIEAAAAAFSGSCAFAKPPGELEGYDVEVRTITKATVFASARFDTGRDNQIGALTRGTTARATGPVASAREAERGFAVLVIDNSGRVCRGYVSAAAVTRHQ